MQTGLYCQIGEMSDGPDQKKKVKWKCPRHDDRDESQLRVSLH